MLATYLKRQTTRATCYASAAGPYLDEFTDWLVQSGFHNEVICQYLPGVIEFAGWVDTTYGNLKPCPFEALGRFRDYLAKHGRLSYSKGQYSASFRGAQHFFKYLQIRNEVVGPKYHCRRHNRSWSVYLNSGCRLTVEYGHQHCEIINHILLIC